MDKELLRKAASGDVAALATLRRHVPANLTVFVSPGGKLDIAATLEAHEYYLNYQTQPNEWNDEPTVNFAQAFPVKVRRHPLTLKPITPGLWTRVWDDGGHELVAAIYWGWRARAIQMSEMELGIAIKSHLEKPTALFRECTTMMRRDGEAMQRAMDAVSAPVECEQVMPCAMRTPVSDGAMDALEEEYRKGNIDIGRYLKLKASTQSVWSHEKCVALNKLIASYFSLSEINTLIFNMSLNGDDFPQRRSSAARELTGWARRRGQLDKLSELVKMANPGRWIEFATEWM